LLIADPSLLRRENQPLSVIRVLEVTVLSFVVCNPANFPRGAIRIEVEQINVKNVSFRIVPVGRKGNLIRRRGKDRKQIVSGIVSQLPDIARKNSGSRRSQEY
jgi:hypothetical protein